MACAAVAVGVLALTAAGAPVAAKARAHRPSGAIAPSARIADFQGADAVGIFRNLTPYPMTFVQSDLDAHWDADFPKALRPGEQFIYRLAPLNHYATTDLYNGVFTYKADAIHGPEYLSLRLYGAHCTGICKDERPLGVSVYTGTRTPVYDRYRGWDFGPPPANPEIAWTSSGRAEVFPRFLAPPYTADFDYTFQTKGTYTLDASKAPPQLAELLNSLCAGASGTTCSFTKTGDIHWGTGALDMQTSVKSCGAKPPTGAVKRISGTPPADSPDWHEVTVEAKRERSVSFGGSLTGSTELNLFGVIDSEVSLTVGTEHEWSDTRTFEKTTRIYVPQNWVAGVWVAPVVGKVTGTVVVSTAVASYTITNFEETASGVSKDLTTPAFNIITYSRPMTAEEYQRLCAERVSFTG